MGTTDGIDLNSFASGTSIKELHVRHCDDVPTKGGVYVVLRVTPGAPEFRVVSSAGWFKHQDPGYPPGVVRDAWVDGAAILYIGKGAAQEGLQQRVRQLVEFAYGKAVGHRGGTLLWHLADWADLQVRWTVCPGSSADELKADMLRQFQQLHRTLPYANRKK